MSNYLPMRTGHSILELLAVLAIMGVVALAGVAVFRLDAIGAVGSQTTANQLARDLQMARRRAISTGKDHILHWTTVSGVTTYQILEEQADLSTVSVDYLHTIPENVGVSFSAADMEFSFDGTAAASYTATFTGADRSFTCQVWSATGNVAVSED